MVRGVRSLKARRRHRSASYLWKFLGSQRGVRNTEGGWKKKEYLFEMRDLPKKIERELGGVKRKMKGAGEEERGLMLTWGKRWRRQSWRP